MEGKIVRIFTAPRASAPMVEVAEVNAMLGKGLEGDRYFDAEGTFSKKESPGRHVTFIESEALDALARDYQIELDASETRRNILTRGVALNHLVGREFVVGSTRLRGIKLCEPCSHLEKMTGKPVKAGLAHRGGLNAEVIRSGSMRVGDLFDVEPEEITQKVTARG